MAAGDRTGRPACRQAGINLKKTMSKFYQIETILICRIYDFRSAPKQFVVPE
jgi:hypothetical protein